MKKESILALALLLFVVLSCNPSNSSPTPTGQSSPPNSGTDNGPVSQSGPDRVDYGPNRCPYENLDYQNQKQQGRVSPCTPIWDNYEQAYRDLRAQRITQQQYAYIEETYYRCCDQNYPHQCR